MTTQNTQGKKLATNARVYINGEEYNFVSLVLEQSFGEHHVFKVIMDYDIMKDRFMGDPSKHMRLIREFLDIDLLQGDDSTTVYEFRGIITNVYHEGKEGKHGYLVLEGLSPTVLLERGKRMDIFSRMDLKRVFEDVVAGIYNKELSYVNNPLYTGRVEFLMQYNESDWEFLRRLSSITGESLYYTGRDLVFGTHKDFKEREVTYDLEIISFQFGSRLLANNFNRYQYLPGQDDTIKHNSNDNIENSNDYVKDAAARVKDFGEKRPVRNPSPLDVGDIGSLTEFVNREKVANAAHTVYVKGTAKTCAPRIGRLLTIKMPNTMPDASDIGTYRITKVTHYIDEMHHYECEFEGIPAALKFYPTPDVRIPVADSIRGVVISNEDPDGQGRVRVDFPFASDRPSETWLRVMTPSAGMTDDKQKNRGMVFIPEKDDQVMVGFEFADPNRPYVMGSMFHGLNGQGGGSNNAVKSIILRCGTQVIFNDDEGSVHIEVPSGTTIDLDGNGNMDVDVPETFTLKCKNMNIEVEENMTSNIGQDVAMEIGNNQSVTVGQTVEISANEKKVNIEQNAEVSVGKKMNLVTNETDIVANSGDIVVKASGKALVQGAEDARISKG